MLAKSTGLKLDEHSKIVECVSDLMFKKICNNNIYNEYIDVVKKSSLLHDIGKLTTSFQLFLSGKKSKTGLKFRHNEIGWAFLSKYLSSEYKNRELILNIVYWHHGISNQQNKHTDTEILDCLDSDSIENMLSYLISIVGEENINQETEYLDSVLSPIFYIESDNIIYLQLCRSIVITSDRISSNLNDISEVSMKLIDDYFNISDNGKVINSKFTGTDRFNKQVDIVEKSFKENTTLIKAPAGFGKTILGLMWGFKNNKKTIWVAPTNSISTSLYYSICEDLSNLGINASVQLILSGEVRKENSEAVIYNSDIIITNIDNFLAPNFKNSIMESSGLLFGANVVFDEFHELICDAPLMSLFVNIMRVRHRLTNSKTLLLSATPMDCLFLWDTISLKTNVLPNKEEHYTSVHKIKYKLRTFNEIPKIEENTNSLVIRNTIKTAQKTKLNGEYDMLIHGEFTNKDKSNLLDKLLTKWGKKSGFDLNKPNVVGTHILQASLDVSFHNLYDWALSPESTIQRIGRVKRWGESEITSNINIIKEDSNHIKKILYDWNLSDNWFKEISNYNSKLITLDELYIIYNKFIKDYKKQIQSYIRGNFDESKKHLSKIYPIKIDLPKRKDDIKTAGSNKLRSVNSEIFYIIKHESGNYWVGPFSKQILKRFDLEFKEESNIYSRMFKTMKIIRDSGDERFDYDDVLENKKYKTIDSIREAARKSNTPYIVYDRYYSDELGVVEYEKKIV